MCVQEYCVELMCSICPSRKISNQKDEEKEGRKRKEEENGIFTREREKRKKLKGWFGLV